MWLPQTDTETFPDKCPCTLEYKTLLRLEKASFSPSLKNIYKLLAKMCGYVSDVRLFLKDYLKWRVLWVCGEVCEVSSWGCWRLWSSSRALLTSLTGAWLAVRGDECDWWWWWWWWPGVISRWPSLQCGWAEGVGGVVAGWPLVVLPVLLQSSQFIICLNILFIFPFRPLQPSSGRGSLSTAANVGRTFSGELGSIIACLSLSSSGAPLWVRSMLSLFRAAVRFFSGFSLFDFLTIPLTFLFTVCSWMAFFRPQMTRTTALAISLAVASVFESTDQSLSLTPFGQVKIFEGTPSSPAAAPPVEHTGTTKWSFQMNSSISCTVSRENEYKSELVESKAYL